MKQINLIPAEYKHARYQRRRTVVWIAFILGVTAMLCSLGLSLHTKIRRSENQNRQMAEKLVAAEQTVKRLAQITAEKADICAKLGHIYAIRGRRTTAATLYAISAACSDRLFLVRLAIEPQKPGEMADAAAPGKAAPPEAQPPGKAPTITAGRRRISLAGYALTNLDLTRFVSGLSGAGRFERVDLKFWRQESFLDLKLIGFEIECSPMIEANDGTQAGKS